MRTVTEARDVTATQRGPGALKTQRHRRTRAAAPDSHRLVVVGNTDAAIRLLGIRPYKTKRAKVWVPPTFAACSPYLVSPELE